MNAKNSDTQSRAPHSVRAEVIDRRTYRRPTKDGKQETFEQSIHRSHYDHHMNLWMGATADPGNINVGELDELEQLALDRKVSVAGRTRWLGGTEYAQSRPVCQFNCAFSEIHSVYDIVDGVWVLLNGSGLGAKGSVGILHGYGQRVDLEVVRSKRGPEEKGNPKNSDVVSGGVRTIKIGDSAEAWAKAVGKMFSPTPGIHTLRLDFSEVRGPGSRLNGYGWICNGDGPMVAAMRQIHGILNSKAGNLLDEIDIGDVVNLIGTVLTTSRKSAELLYMDDHNPRSGEFSRAKLDSWRDAKHRQQSNNSLCFYNRPDKKRIATILQENLWGADLGFINGQAALRRAPWFKGLNPCAEILLGAFCNLFEINAPAFGRNFAALEQAVYIGARANYRQTCVDLRDGVLQPKWHQSNEALRLCGVSLTGIVQAEHLSDYDIRRLRNAAVVGAYSMADELGMPRPKAVTTVKPSGTLSKTFGTPGMEVAEGIHKPLGKFIFNWVGFSISDPIVATLIQAGYDHIVHPSDPGSVLIKFPVKFRGIDFTESAPGKFINTESAVDQLNRYFKWVSLWADHNVSVTISYDEAEIPEIVDLLHARWDDFVAVSWMRRNNPDLRPEDIGVPYLPQQVVTAEVHGAYVARLREPVWKDGGGELVGEDNCVGGACPAR